MDEFKPNSHKSKEELNEPIASKKIEKVITGSAKKKKKTGFDRLTDIFMPEDIGDVKSYIVTDVLIPSLKKAIHDIVTNGIEMWLYPGSGKPKGGSTSSKISYRSYYDKQDDRRDRLAPRTSPGLAYDDILLESRGEAETVLTRMDEIVSTYGVVSVADLYDLVDITGNYTDHNYGWTDITTASVVRVRDGYIIKLPRALPLK